MKKSFLLVVALLTIVSINAKEIIVDLSKGVEEVTDGEATDGKVTLSFANDVATVQWMVNVNWGIAGVEFPLDNLAEITSFSFEYKGDGNASGMLPYLRDLDGNRWWNNETWSSLSETDWTEVTVNDPFTSLWDGGTVFGAVPFTRIGFVANAGVDEGEFTEESGVFELKNVIIIVPDKEEEHEAVENVQALSKTVKVIRNGQMMILRDGKTFNALGAEMK